MSVLPLSCCSRSRGYGYSSLGLPEAQGGRKNSSWAGGMAVVLHFMPEDVGHKIERHLNKPVVTAALQGGNSTSPQQLSPPPVNPSRPAPSASDHVIATAVTVPLVVLLAVVLGALAIRHRMASILISCIKRGSHNINIDELLKSPTLTLITTGKKSACRHACSYALLHHGLFCACHA